MKKIQLIVLVALTSIACNQSRETKSNDEYTGRVFMVNCGGLLHFTSDDSVNFFVHRGLDKEAEELWPGERKGDSLIFTEPSIGEAILFGVIERVNEKYRFGFYDIDDGTPWSFGGTGTETYPLYELKHADVDSTRNLSELLMSQPWIISDVTNDYATLHYELGWPLSEIEKDALTKETTIGEMVIRSDSSLVACDNGGSPQSFGEIKLESCVNFDSFTWSSSKATQKMEIMSKYDDGSLIVRDYKRDSTFEFHLYEPLTIEKVSFILNKSNK